MNKKLMMLAVMALTMRAIAADHVPLPSWQIPLAANVNDIKELKRFLGLGHNINDRDGQGFSALHWAAWKGNKEIVEFLLAHNAKINVRNNENATPLHLAAAAGRLEVVELLCAQPHIGIILVDNDENSALDNALDANHQLVVEFLEKRAPSTGRNARLRIAASQGDIEQVKALLTAGANVHSKYWLNGTALHCAANAGHLEIVKLLVEHGADLNAKSYENKTVLDAAQEAGKAEVVEYLKQVIVNKK